MKKNRVILIACVYIISIVLININLFAASSSNTDEQLLEEEMGFYQSEPQVCDPLEPYNRKVTAFNDKLYFWVVKPPAKGYAKVVPQKVRVWIFRFFKNLMFPIRFVNSILQFKFKKAGIETARFVINSTLGVAGFGDPAKNWFHLTTSPEDFGQTLGFYHFKHPWYLCWPFLGPSDTRDTIGMVGDFFLNPINYLPNFWLISGIYVFEKLNNVSLHLGEYEKMKKESIDYYIFMRNAYEQHRDKLIKE